MALEAVVFQHEPFSYPYPCKDFYNPVSGYGFDDELLDKPSIQSLAKPPGVTVKPSLHCSGNNWDTCAAALTPEWDNTGNNSSSTSPENNFTAGGLFPAAAAGRRKRRRARAVKNKEEVENQRMTHIAVERNRRKQMNEYLAVLRSMMPPTYVHRGDQASIIGGAINFVKELEHLLHSLKTQKSAHDSSDHHHHLQHQITRSSANTSDESDSSSVTLDPSSALFSDFFTFPQYSTTSAPPPTHYHNPSQLIDSMMPEIYTNAIADVEVTMVDSHANIKVLSRKQPKQLLKMVVGLQSLCLNILHLNVTTSGLMVLYSISVKVEENCQLTSVNEIAAAVYEMVGRIQDESFHN